MQVRQLVDEQEGAIKREHGDEAEQERQPGAIGEDGPGERGIAERRGAEHVRPVDGAPRLADVAGQLGGGAHHRLVVGNVRVDAPAR